MLGLSDQDAPPPAAAAAAQLPGGGTVQVTERDACNRSAGQGADRHSLALVYNAPALGPVDLRFDLDPGSLRVTAVLAAGEPAEQARARATELTRRAVGGARPAGRRSTSPPAASRSTSMPEPGKEPERRRATALRYEQGRRAPEVVRHRRRAGRRSHPRGRARGGHSGPARPGPDRGARRARARGRGARGDVDRGGGNAGLGLPARRAGVAAAPAKGRPHPADSRGSPLPRKVVPSYGPSPYRHPHAR